MNNPPTASTLRRSHLLLEKGRYRTSQFSIRDWIPERRLEVKHFRDNREEDCCLLLFRLVLLPLQETVNIIVFLDDYDDLPGPAFSGFSPPVDLLMRSLTSTITHRNQDHGETMRDRNFKEPQHFVYSAGLAVTVAAAASPPLRSVPLVSFLCLGLLQSTSQVEW